MAIKSTTRFLAIRLKTHAHLPFSKTNGKIECLRNMNLEGEVQMIGDGYSDYVTREAGVADVFFAYTENVTRPKTIKNADHIVPNLDEFLYINDLPREISYPKNRINILLLENIHTDAYEKFTKDGFTVETVGRGLSEEELIENFNEEGYFNNDHRYAIWIRSIPILR